MSNAWDIKQLRKIAGLPLNESWDRDDDYGDDEDADVAIASKDKRQAEFEKKNKGELSSAQKEAAAKAKAAAAKKAEEKKPEAKPAEKKEEPKAAPAAKKEEPKAEEKKSEDKPAEAKRRGKAPNENSFNQQAKKYAKEHSRASFIAWAAEKHGKGKAYASTLFAKYNPKSGREVQQANELWVITHPHMSSFVLAEDRAMKTFKWIDPASALDALIFVSEAEAQKTAKYLSEWKGQASVVQKFDVSDEAADE